jgi:hypothetical protein
VRALSVPSSSIGRPTWPGTSSTPWVRLVSC